MTPDPFRRIIREELQLVERRIGLLENRLTSAILILADNLPGSMPGGMSHVRTQIEGALVEGSR